MSWVRNDFVQFGRLRRLMYMIDMRRFRKTSPEVVARWNRELGEAALEVAISCGVIERPA